MFIKISERFPKSIPKFIKALSRSILPAEDDVIVGRISEIFWDAGYQGRAFACAFGIAHTDAPKALNVLSKLTIDEGPVPGIFAMRFVKKSKGLLAFTRFPTTCMLEIDGIQWKGNGNIISLERYAERMIEVLQQHNIPFTIHWGKNAAWNFSGLATHMYGNDAALWLQYRSALLSEEMASVFSNDFLKTLGLSHYFTNADPNLVASL